MTKWLGSPHHGTQEDAKARSIAYWEKIKKHLTKGWWKWTNQYYSQLHPNVFLVLYHICLEQHLIFVLTCCDQECPEEQQTLIPSFSHYPLGLGELVQGAFSAQCQRDVKLVLNSSISMIKNKQVNYLHSPNVPKDHHLLFSPSAFCQVQDPLCKQSTDVIYFYFLISRERICYLLQGTRCTHSKTGKWRYYAVSAKQKMGSSIVKHN